MTMGYNQLLTIQNHTMKTPTVDTAVPFDSLWTGCPFMLCLVYQSYQ